MSELKVVHHVSSDDSSMLFTDSTNETQQTSPLQSRDETNFKDQRNLQITQDEEEEKKKEFVPEFTI